MCDNHSDGAAGCEDSPKQIHKCNQSLNNSDEYYTSLDTWKTILHLLPKHKMAWEGFVGPDSRSLGYLRELGVRVTGFVNVDFFNSNSGDYLLSNPPFSKKREIIARLAKLKKPFMMVWPISAIPAQYLRELGEEDIQIVIPWKRLRFETLHSNETSEPTFGCVWLCYKMNLENGKKLIFLPKLCA